MKLLHISDTHTFHNQIVLPKEKDIDIIIFSGDESNGVIGNEKEYKDFMDWYSNLPFKYKLYIPGNHSHFAFSQERHAKEYAESLGVIYLNKSSVVIEGVKFWGDPITPRFGNWFFMASREKMYKHWDMIPDDTDVLIVHGPPKGVLDLSENRQGELERCGCSALNKKIKKLSKLKACLFGHIHSYKDIENTGLLIRNNVIYSNAASVIDGRFDKGIVHHGNIVEL